MVLWWCCGVFDSVGAFALWFVGIFVYVSLFAC